MLGGEYYAGECRNVVQTVNRQRALGSNLLGMGMTRVVEFVCKICNTRFFKRPEELGSGIPQCPVCIGAKPQIDAAAPVSRAPTPVRD